MSKTERLYRIEALIKGRGHASFATLREALEVSPATLKRDLEYLRSRLGAPIEYDRFVNGYRFGAGWRGEKHELPGLWFDERELYALLMAHQLLSSLDGDGVLSRHLQPLLARIHQMLGAAGGGDDAPALLERVRIVSAARRPVPSRFFELVAEALLERRRLAMRYFTRGRGEVTERVVSPQRLVHYRSTWYLDAWCHKAGGLRRFALDAIEQAALADDRAREIPMKAVRSAMDTGYGIYAGGTPRWAVLLFEPNAAQWVSREEWHPDAKGGWLADGRYELRLPYVDETELVMDVLRQGEEVRVVAPASLRQAVAQRLQRAAARYAAGSALRTSAAPGSGGAAPAVRTPAGSTGSADVAPGQRRTSARPAAPRTAGRTPRPAAPPTPAAADPGPPPGAPGGARRPAR
jgi:predicted DNA-binding transcriptional regulator YafY